VPTLRDTVGVPLIVLSRNDDHVAAINAMLREAGHPVHCKRVDQPNHLEEALQAHQPELVLLFDNESSLDLPSVAAQLAKHDKEPPLLLVRSHVDEQTVATAMESGARDVVSLTHRNRFKAVVARELQAFRLKVALNGVLSSASQYKQELRNLMTGATEAIADVHDGIIVAANPAWLNLFGYENEDELASIPFMDLFRSSDQPSLKGALVACLKGKWEDEAIQVAGHTAEGRELPLELRMERVTIDAEPAVRVIVPGERSADQSPEELLEQAVYKDPSTGFFHRHYFLERLHERLASPLTGGIRAIAYIRPDNFARIHDDVGLLATEALLMRFAELLKEFMLQPDLYGRFGGTMFVVLLERGTMTDVESWAEQVRKAVAKQVFEVEQGSTSLTCTVGLCEVAGEEQTVAELLAEVESSCRLGRDAGGNRVQLTESSSVTQRTRQSDAMWIPRLRDALMRNRLRLVHQPVTSLNEDIQDVFDTRVRMLDEKDRLILPKEFIPAAERAGMIKNIDRWVIGASFSFCAARRPSLVFVRLARDSVADDTLLAWLTARLRSTRIAASQVCFQVTEEVAAQKLKQTKALAEKLQAAGFRFAVDHLGTGRDSAQVISHVPMSFAKIDGSLMQGLHRDTDLQSRVGELAKVAQQQNIKTIAERVEDANTMAVLWQLGVAYIQGNFNQMHMVVLEDTISTGLPNPRGSEA
jgi:diguanylate cyclase (GGDEF)-like protein/PAS domain S-box-containing protein